VRAAWLLAVGVLLAVPPPAGAASAQEVLRDCGLVAELTHGARALLLTVNGELSKREAGIDDTTRERLMQRARAELTESRLHALALELLPQHLQAADAGAQSAWCNSPAGRAVVQAELRAAATQDDMNANPYAPGANWHDTPLPRRELIENLVEAGNDVRDMAEMGMAVAEASAALVQALDPSRAQPDRDILLRGFREMLSGDGARHAHFHFCEMVALSLKGVPDDAIVAYTAHRKSAAGQRWRQFRQTLGVRALKDTLARLARPA
jgi:hypothetical protein